MGRVSAHRVLSICSIVGRVLAVLLFLLAFTPTLFYLYPELPKYFLFDNRGAHSADYAPSAHGFTGRNFYLSSATGMIPVWHLLPNGTKEPRDADGYENLLKKENQKIMFYVHGNTQDRADKIRLPVYTKLINDNWHVITFDYRGFAENAGDTSGYAAVEETKLVYRWLRRHSGHNKVIVWTYSLGVAFGARAMSDLTTKEGYSIDGFIAESAFSTTRRAIQDKVAYKVTFGWLPTFVQNLVFDQLFHQYGLDFNVMTDLESIPAPIMHMHAMDDIVISPKLADEIRQHMKDNNKKDFRRIIFKHCKGLGHYIGQRSDEIIPLIRGYMNMKIYKNATETAS